VVVDAWYLRTTEDRTTLQPVQRRVTPPATAAARLEALLAGPTTQENGAGISTAIPSGTTLSERPREVGNVLTVSLSRQFYDDLRGESARNAFAQVVFTATEIAGVDSVQFVLDREPFPAIDGQREQRNGPLGRDDYQSLLDG
jgi:spore germination protein GerM